MRLVTVKTAKFCLFHMQVVLTYPCFIPMAVLKAVIARKLDLAMRFVTVKTFQGGHYSL